MRRLVMRRLAKRAAFAACLLPLVVLASRAALDDLGANPIEAVTRTLGDWALRFLVLTLAVTPVRLLTGWSTLAGYRRMLGLFAFFFAALHVSSYVMLDQFFDFAAIGGDIVKRKFITIGLVAFLLMVPLAATSTNRMIKRLGATRWRRLHRLAYAAGALAIVHFLFMVKVDTREPLIYAGVLGCLLGARVLVTVSRSRSRNGEPTAMDVRAES